MGNKRNNLHEFEEFVLNAAERNLWRDDELVPMPPKVFDTLCMLVENHGVTLTKNEMLGSIWGDTFVEENNVSQNISNLRKILGKDRVFIETVPKKGFRFVAPVKTVSLDEFSYARSGGNGFIVARQSRSNVIEESTVEREVHDPAGSSIEPTRKSKRILYLGLGIALVSIVVLGAFAFRLPSGRTIKSAIPTASFDYIDLTDSGDVTMSTISPNGKFVAFHNDKSLRLMDLETRNDVGIEIDGEKKIGWIQFSPDGKWIYFRTRGNLRQFENIYRISKFGGNAKQIAKDTWGRFSVSPDGRNIVHYARDATNSRHQVVVKEIDTGNERIVRERPSANGFNILGPPVYSPDGEKIATTPSVNRGLKAKISVLHTSSEKEEIIETEFISIRQMHWSPDGKSLFLIAHKKGQTAQIWNVSFPEGKTNRVTSDSHAYRSLSISSNGRLSANRLYIYSNLWILPEGDITRAEQLTKGENEIGGLVTTQVIRNGEVLFSARRDAEARMWAINIETREQRKLIEKDIGGNQQFGYSKKLDQIFCEFQDAIWKMNSDGTGFQEVELGDADKFSQPAVSPDDKWLYYVKRVDKKAMIWRSSLDGTENELVLDAKGFSPDNFLRISPDGRFLAFNYVKPKKIGDDRTTSRNIRQFGFLDLVGDSGVKVIEVPSHNTLISWTEGGKSFDFPGYVEGGTAVFRKSVLDDSPAREIVRIDNEMIYRFGWSPDEKNLIIARGNHKMDVVLISPRETKE